MTTSKSIILGRTKLEAFAGSGGLFNVILHSAKGQQQVELTPGEFAALELAAECLSMASRRAEADRLEINRLQLQRDALAASEAANLERWRRAREVIDEVVQLRHEVAELRAKQAAFVEASSHGR